MSALLALTGRMGNIEVAMKDLKQSVSNSQATTTTSSSTTGPSHKDLALLSEKISKLDKELKEVSKTAAAGSTPSSTATNDAFVSQLSAIIQRLQALEKNAAASKGGNVGVSENGVVEVKKVAEGNAEKLSELTKEKIELKKEVEKLKQENAKHAEKNSSLEQQFAAQQIKIELLEQMIKSHQLAQPSSSQASQTLLQTSESNIRKISAPNPNTGTKIEQQSRKNSALGLSVKPPSIEVKPASDPPSGAASNPSSKPPSNPSSKPSSRPPSNPASASVSPRKNEVSEKLSSVLESAETQPLVSFKKAGARKSGTRKIPTKKLSELAKDIAKEDSALDLDVVSAVEEEPEETKKLSVTAVSGESTEKEKNEEENAATERPRSGTIGRSAGMGLGVLPGMGEALAKRSQRASMGNLGTIDIGPPPPGEEKTKREKGFFIRFSLGASLPPPPNFGGAAPPPVASALPPPVAGGSPVKAKAGPKVGTKNSPVKMKNAPVNTKERSGSIFDKMKGGRRGSVSNILKGN